MIPLYTSNTLTYACLFNHNNTHILHIFYIDLISLNIIEFISHKHPYIVQYNSIIGEPIEHSPQTEVIPDLSNNTRVQDTMCHVTLEDIPMVEHILNALTQYPYALCKDLWARLHPQLGKICRDLQKNKASAITYLTHRGVPVHPCDQLPEYLEQFPYDWLVKQPEKEDSVEDPF